MTDDSEARWGQRDDESVAIPDDAQLRQEDELDAQVDASRPEAGEEGVDDETSEKQYWSSKRSAEPDNSREYAGDYGLQPPLEVRQETGLRYGTAIGIGVIGAIAGAALALLILWAVNGTLSFDRSPALIDLQASVDQLASENERLTGELQALQTTADDLQSSVTAIPALESDVQQLSDRADQIAAGVSETQTQVDEVQDRVGGLEGSVDEVSQSLDGVTAELADVSVSADRSDTFLSGLAGLLQNVLPEGVTPESTAEAEDQGAASSESATESETAETPSADAQSEPGEGEDEMPSSQTGSPAPETTPSPEGTPSAPAEAPAYAPEESL